jgi:hypoxanthine phosphoribosyltransferase
MLSQYLEIPMHTLKVSLRDGGDNDVESNLWMASDAFEGKRIMIVDDINDTGATFNWIMQDWSSGCLADDPRWQRVWNDSIKFAVLVDNLGSQCKTKMSYTGMEIDKSQDDCWIDFPWEVWWR